MRKFLEPKSVAVIGVPRHTGPGSFNNIETLLNYGYKGKIFPINPSTHEICGLKVYPSIGSLSEIPDLAVISVGRDRVLKVVEECGSIGIGRAIIITQGFSDADRRGADLQGLVLKAAVEWNMRIVGPNTMGVLNNHSRFTTSFIDLPFPGEFEPVSIIGQSGIFQVGANIFNFYNWAKVIDIGNAADIDHLDMLKYLGSDDQTRVIVLHIEGIKRGKEFLETALEISKIKPIIAFKTGRTKAGANAAISHSGSLAGEDMIMDAAFEKAGILRVKDASECQDAIKALLKMQPMKGPRLGVLTITGAGGIMAADACEDHGLKLAEIPDDLGESLTRGLPEWIRISNPVDIWPVGMIGGNFKESYFAALCGLLKSPDVDGVIAALLSTYSSSMHKDLDLLEPIRNVYSQFNNGKPLALWIYPDEPAATDIFEKIGGIACFKSMERAVRGLAYCYKWNNYKNMKVSFQKKFKIDKILSNRLAEKGRSEGLLLGEDALELLRSFGIPCVEGKIASSLKDIEDGASRFGYPLVLKVFGNEFVHKTEVGGIIVDIRNRSMLRRARRVLTKRITEKHPWPKPMFQVQRQVMGEELLLGLKRDPQFGHSIICGAGGIYTEVLKDTARGLVPIGYKDAELLLKSLRIWPILEGTRGKEGVNIENLIEIMERLSFLALQIPDITELDINPVMASYNNCLAVDARILWRS